MKGLAGILITLGAIIAVAGFCFSGYEGIIEPNQPGHSFGTGDKLELVIGAVVMYLGLIGVVLGVLSIKIAAFIEPK